MNGSKALKFVDDTVKSSGLTIIRYGGIDRTFVDSVGRDWFCAGDYYIIDATILVPASLVEDTSNV